MNKHQFKGSWRQFTGEAKKQWGQFTDNDLLEAEGDYDRFLEAVQKRYGDQKEEVERWAEVGVSGVDGGIIGRATAIKTENLPIRLGPGGVYGSGRSFSLFSR